MPGKQSPTADSYRARTFMLGVPLDVVAGADHADLLGTEGYQVQPDPLRRGEAVRAPV